MKKNIKIIVISLLVLIVLLTFLSKTIYNYNLSVVTGVLPKSGTLTKTETTTGNVKWGDLEEIYSETSGRVEEILVKEGDKVTKGQALVKLSFDTDETKLKIKQLGIDKNKLSLELESMNLKINKLKKSLGSIGNDALPDYDLTTLEDKIARAKEKLADLKSLYEVDAVARNEVEGAEFELDSLNKEYKNLSQKKNDELVALQKDLETKNLDMDMLEIQQKSLQNTLKAFNKTTIYASSDGTITKIPIKKGQQLNANELIVSFGKNHSFEIECQINFKNNFIAVGDTAELTNADHKFEGQVSKITLGETSKKLIIKIVSKEITEGEAFNIKFNKVSKNSYILVPNGAINKDKDEYFIYSLKRRDGMLGQEFYAEKIKVDIGDSSDENTIITNGITFFEPIVLISDKQFSEGDTLKIKNEGDFFVK